MASTSCSCSRAPPLWAPHGTSTWAPGLDPCSSEADTLENELHKNSPRELTGLGGGAGPFASPYLLTKTKNSSCPCKLFQPKVSLRAGPKLLILWLSPTTVSSVFEEWQLEILKGERVFQEQHKQSQRHFLGRASTPEVGPA